MAFETLELTGAIFKNNRRTDSNNQPNMSGTCKINGEEYYISAWTKTAKSGSKYQSLAFTLKKESQPVDHLDEDYDPDIPF